jgi:CHASE2 domain-containing sensor protein
MLLRSAAKREVRIPRSIGPYKVERLLASGGMGDVYLCLDERLGKKVAVKLARPELASEPGLMDQIRDEGRRLASVKRNVYVARVLTAGDQAIDGVSVPYVAMEYEEGEPLGGPISNAWPIRKKVEVFTNVCKAVEALHEQHLVHADIKPSNIILAGEEPRLIDFGIARVVRRLGGEPGQLCAGTPGYFDPAVGGTTGKAPDQRTDIYCLGLTLAAFLAGKEPNADQPSGWPSRGIPPSTENPAIDAELDAIILKAIERDPSKRHQSVAEFRHALARWSAARKVHARALATAAVLIFSAAFGVVFGGPLSHRLHLNDWFERQVFAAPPASAPSMDRSAVVGLQTLDEVTQVADYLRESGVEFGAVDLDDAKTWRPVYPALLRALRESEARCVTFDIVFKSPQTVDEIFHAAAEESPFPVVVGLDLGSTEVNPAQSPNKTLLAPPIEWGGVSAFFDSDSAWKIDLLASRDDWNRPMLSLRTLAAWNYPKMNHRFARDGSSSITIDADVPDTANPSITRPAQIKTRVAVTGTDIAVMASPEDRLLDGIAEGDRVSQLLISMPKQSAIDGITHSMIEVLRATPAQRRTWFMGRAVFVANMTPVAQDKFGYPDGRAIWGVYGHAVAFETLLSNRAIRMAEMPVSALACALAALVPVSLLRPRSKGWLRAAPVLVALLTVAATVMLCHAMLSHTRWYLPAWSPALAALSAGILVVFVNVWFPKRPR